jgi:nucleoside-diphosphate-sugar epimerase
LVDAGVPQAEYAALYRRAAGEHWRTMYLPVAALAPAAFGAELAFKALRRAAPVTRHQLRRTTWSARYDCSRAERELGWRPRVDVAEGLRRCFGAVG